MEHLSEIRGVREDHVTLIRDTHDILRNNAAATRLFSAFFLEAQRVWEEQRLDARMGYNMNSKCNSFLKKVLTCCNTNACIHTIDEITMCVLNSHVEAVHESANSIRKEHNLPRIGPGYQAELPVLNVKFSHVIKRSD